MIAFESAIQLAEGIRNKDISSRELTELYIERIEKYDDQINAVVVRTFAEARAAADAADAALARGAFFGEDQRAGGSGGLSELQPYIRYNR